MRLITQASVDAAHIAAIVLGGVDARKRVILTDRLGRAGVLLQAVRAPALRPHAHRAGQAVGPARRASTPRSSPVTEALAEVRDEDAFDVERVAAWLRENASMPSTGPSSPACRRCASSSVGPPTSPTCCVSTAAATSSCVARRSAPRPRARTTWAASTTYSMIGASRSPVGL